jgi:hypothetical protein
LFIKRNSGNGKGAYSEAIILRKFIFLLLKEGSM